MSYVRCYSCHSEMSGILNPDARDKCDRCGGKARLAHGADITPAEREEIFAYHDRIRHLYSSGSRSKK